MFQKLAPASLTCQSCQNRTVYYWCHQNKRKSAHVSSGIPYETFTLHYWQVAPCGMSNVTFSSFNLLFLLLSTQNVFVKSRPALRTAQTLFFVFSLQAPLCWTTKFINIWLHEEPHFAVLYFARHLIIACKWQVLLTECKWLQFEYISFPFLASFVLCWMMTWRNYIVSCSALNNVLQWYSSSSTLSCIYHVFSPSQH